MVYIKYQEVLNKNLSASAKKLPMDCSWIIQDNDLKLQSIKTKIQINSKMVQNLAIFEI